MPFKKILFKISLPSTVQISPVCGTPTGRGYRASPHGTRGRGRGSPRGDSDGMATPTELQKSHEFKDFYIIILSWNIGGPAASYQ